jgi:hypothetical protein
MKIAFSKSILSVVLALVLLTSSALQAKNSYIPIHYSIYSVQNILSIRLTIENVPSQIVTVRIYSEGGTLIHDEKITKTGVSVKMYDMTLLGAGIYKVELSAKGFKSVEMIKVGLPQSRNILVGKINVDYNSEIEKNATQSSNNILVVFSENDLYEFIEENASREQ